MILRNAGVCTVPRGGRPTAQIWIVLARAPCRRVFSLSGRPTAQPSLSGRPTAQPLYAAVAPPLNGIYTVVLFMPLKPFLLGPIEMAKRQRCALIGLHGVPDRALVDILGRLRADPVLLEDIPLRQHLTDEVNRVFLDAGGCLLPLALIEKSNPHMWAVFRPQSLVRYFIEQAPAFRSIMRSSLRAKRPSPTTPWNILFYQDDITPGNVLRPDLGRKCTCVYFSFKELQGALRSEDVWLPMAILKVSVTKFVDGGLAHAMRLLLRLFFVAEEGFQDTGVAIDAGDGPVLLFARLSNMIGDEAALKTAWQAKGASGTCPCFVCKNIVMKGSGLEDPTGYLLDITCSSPEAFDMKQNADVWAAFDNLERSKPPALPKSAFSRLEQATGLNYSSMGILADAELRRYVLPIAVHTYDSMHTFWSNGCAAVELYLFLQACANTLDLRYAALDMLCKADWGHCKHMPLKLKHIFTETRERANSTSFKAMASEVISVMPVVAYFAETVVEPTGHLQEEVASFKAFHAVGVLVQKLKFGACTALQLQSALQSHLPLFVKAYGPEWVRPKHHFAMHIPLQIQRDTMLLDTCVHERKHKLVKGYAGHHDSDVAFEKAVLTRCIIQQCRQLQEADRYADRLQGSREELPAPLLHAFGATRGHIAPEMHFEHVTASVGDLLVAKSGAVLILNACLELDGSLKMLVHNLIEVEAHWSWARYERASTPSLFDPAAGVSFARLWEQDGNFFKLLR